MIYKANRAEEVKDVSAYNGREMKYLVFSDLHGSLRGLQRLQAAINLEKPDLVLCLGDTLHGAYDDDPGAVIRYLSTCPVTIMGVRGNCDSYYDEQSLGFATPETLTLYLDGHPLILRHAPFYYGLAKGDVAMFGHTHVKTLHEDDGVIFLNPGSIGKPRDDCASYAVLGQGRIALKNADTFEEISALHL